MTKLLIPQIDKANHIIVGYLVYVISCFFLSPLLSFIPVILIGSLKELVDMIRYKRSFDYLDFIYTIAGAVPASMLNLI